MALLSACGLYAPVQSALVPYTDAFMLRNFSADSPLEGKSSFAVEMVEMRSALNCIFLCCQIHIQCRQLHFPGHAN